MSATGSVPQDMLHCRICPDLLYEPFCTPCGHTFCYSCLNSTFKHNPIGKRVNCPECRTAIRQAPAPNYLVRQLVQHLITQPEFMAEHETVELHKTRQAEEAAIVDRDRKEPDGLFQGRFKPQPPRLGPIRDLEDGVERCPQCSWEIEEDSDVCGHCGLDFNEISSDEYDGMDGHDPYLDDGEGSFGLDAELAAELLGDDEDHAMLHSMAHMSALHGSYPGRSSNGGHGSASPSDSTERGYDSDLVMDYEEEDSDESEDEDDDGESDTSMDGFIDDDDDDDDDDEPEEGEDASNPVSISSSPAPVSERGESDESAEENESSPDESASDVPRQGGAQPASAAPVADKRRRRNHPIVIESSEEEEESMDEDPVPQPRLRRRAA